MRNLIYFAVILILSACRNGKGIEKAADEHTAAVEKEMAGELNPREETRKFQDSIFQIGFEYPAGLEVFQGELMPNTPVINVYLTGIKQSPPFGIHEDPALSYIAILPKGFGVDAPAGKRVALKDLEEYPPLDLSINSTASTAYLLENGKPWAYSFRFYENVKNWNEYGSIFVSLGIDNFRATCEEQEGEEKVKMENCDPLAGDVIRYYGEVKEKESDLILKTLKTLYIFSLTRKREKIVELIQVTAPAENERISSPLRIKGMAKGYWFFEADAPFLLVNEHNKILARGSVTAEGDWMTEKFVPFTATVIFDPLGSEAGYIIFQRSNASGKPEHDRSYRLPVKF